MDRTLVEAKAAARKNAAALRKAAHALHAEDAPRLLASIRFPLKISPACKIVSAFHPFRSEIDTRPLLGRLAGEGWTTALPVIVAADKPLQFRRWLPGEPTVTGAMGIETPMADAPVVTPDVLIVPLLAFDRRGYRLGYGGGYYDRTIAELRAQRPVIAIGAAYAAQESQAVPHGQHDQRLDYIMTESGLTKCG